MITIRTKNQHIQQVAVTQRVAKNVLVLYSLFGEKVFGLPPDQSGDGAFVEHNDDFSAVVLGDYYADGRNGVIEDYYFFRHNSVNLLNGACLKLDPLQSPVFQSSAYVTKGPNLLFAEKTCFKSGLTVEMAWDGIIWNGPAMIIRYPDKVYKTFAPSALLRAPMAPSTPTTSGAHNIRHFGLQIRTKDYKQTIAPDGSTAVELLPGAFRGQLVEPVIYPFTLDAGLVQPANQYINLHDILFAPSDGSPWLLHYEPHGKRDFYKPVGVPVETAPKGDFDFIVKWGQRYPHRRARKITPFIPTHYFRHSQLA
jgi:hypothetical protein